MLMGAVYIFMYMNIRIIFWYMSQESLNLDLLGMSNKFVRLLKEESSTADEETLFIF